MYWPVVFPFELTCLLMVMIVAIAILLAPYFHLSRSKAFNWSLLISFLAFVPACTSIKHVVDSIRFGSFESKDYHAVESSRADRHLVRYLPKSAKSIHAKVGAIGIHARYHISREGLDAWMNEQWQLYGNEAASPYSPPKAADEYDLKTAQQLFDDAPSTMTKGMLKFDGPRKGNGGGSTIYYDEKAGIAYQDTGYW